MSKKWWDEGCQLRRLETRHLDRVACEAVGIGMLTPKREEVLSRPHVFNLEDSRCVFFVIRRS